MSRPPDPRRAGGIRPRLRTRIPGLWACFATLTVTALVAGSAHADDERPLTWSMSQDELQAIGLGQSRGDPVPVPDDAPLSGRPQHTEGGASGGTIFVNFDGASLSSGFDNSRANQTQIGQLAGNFSAYGAGSKRDAVLQAVRDDWAAYNVTITDVRPDSGEYVMNMTGPTNPFGGGVLGIAPLDCDDQQTRNNITYAFHSANDQFSAATTATTIGQEVAHSFGLEHVDEQGDIMNPFNAGGDPQFNDRCIQIVQGASCTSQHARHCGSATQQNAHAELLDLLGASAPDTMAPALSIVAPVDGEEFETGSDFQIIVDATDDAGLAEVSLLVNGEVVQVGTSGPYEWGVEGIPEGNYELVAIAVDLAGNEASSNTVSIVVGDPPASDDGGGDGDGDGDGDGGSGADGDGGQLPPDFGEERDAGGCGCRSTPASPLGLTMLLVAVGAVRRRRS